MGLAEKAYEGEKTMQEMCNLRRIVIQLSGFPDKKDDYSLIEVNASFEFLTAQGYRVVVFENEGIWWLYAKR